jgi:hypothetical protein
MSVIDNFLDVLGSYIERRKQDRNIQQNATTAGISAQFLRDARRQQGQSFFFHRGVAPPRKTFTDEAHVNYLRDGCAPPPRRRQ